MFFRTLYIGLQPPTENGFIEVKIDYVKQTFKEK